MFGGEFWRSLRAEHVVLLLGWVIGGAVFWADTRSSLGEQGRSIVQLQQQRLRDDSETSRRVHDLSTGLASIQARLNEVGKSVDEVKADVRRGWNGSVGSRP